MSKEVEIVNKSAQLAEVVELVGLSPAQYGAIIALLNAPTLAAAAKKSGASVRSLYRWLGEPAFKAALREARQTAVRQASAYVQGASGEAVKTLLEIMRKKEATPSSRVSAARTALQKIYHLIEADDVAERLAALEKARARSGQNRGRGGEDSAGGKGRFDRSTETR